MYGIWDRKKNGNPLMDDFHFLRYNGHTRESNKRSEIKIKEGSGYPVARSRNDAVERALYECAVGSTRPVQKKYKLKRVEYNEATGKKLAEYEEIVDGVEEVYTPPSVSAMQFWLRSRMPEKWGGLGAGQTPGRIELPEVGADAGGPEGEADET